MSTIANQTATSATLSKQIAPTTAISAIMRPKQITSIQVKPAPKALPTGVKNMLAVGNALVQQFGQLKADVFDRSDKALWTYLGEVNKYKSSIESHPDKQAIKTALLNEIHIREKAPMSSASSLEAVVVRYIFGDQSRQTRSNYTTVFEKATALGIPVDDFVDFLAQHGGVSKVIEHVFDDDKATAQTAKEIAEGNKATQANRTQLVQRLFAATAHNPTGELSYAGEVVNWVPPKPEKKGKTSDKADLKYMQGQFVFFVTVHDQDTGKYRVVQGNIFDKAYEQKLLGEIASRLEAETVELEEAVQSLEQSIGFDGLSEEGSPIED